MGKRVSWLGGGVSLALACLGAYQVQWAPWGMERGASPSQAAGLVERSSARLRAVSRKPPFSGGLVEAVRQHRELGVGSNKAIEPGRLDELIREAAGRTGLSPALIRAVAHTESDFRPGVVSSAGAVGLMQVRPVAAAELSERLPDWAAHLNEREGVAIKPEDLADPRLNVLLGSHYLAELRERYAEHGEPLATWLALAAYNWGPTNVDRRILSHPHLHTLKDLRWLLYRRAPYETRAFIDRVLERSDRARQAPAYRPGPAGRASSG